MDVTPGFQIRHFLRRSIEPWTLNRAYLRNRHLTMIRRQQFVDNLRVARGVLLPMKELAVVECGVWRGGASMAMMEIFPECREFHLFDSFEGLPEPGERDGRKANELSSENLFVEGRNFASYEDLTQEIRKRNLEDRANVHKGWFEDTVTPDKIQRPIGVLRLDGDWYDSTILVLERLYDSVVEGGRIIVDDYYSWPGCSRALHDFLSSRDSPDTIRSSRHGVAFIKKKPADFAERSLSEKELERRRKANVGA